MGFFRHHVATPDRIAINLRVLAPGQVAPFLREVRAEFPTQRVSLFMPAGLNEALAPVLAETGCESLGAQVHLAYVRGPPASSNLPGGLRLESVTAQNLHDYVIAERQGFADSDSAPAPEAILTYVNILLAEMAGEGRFLLARIDGETAATLGWYDGVSDRFVFMLATRAPFRRRGIARTLLVHTTREALAIGKDAVIINGAADGFPVAFYRRFGFSDEVCRHFGYLVA
ncbi:MAG: GNAT family N-acetyltransferase [Chloroflexi bacterium]|nr:GNAT family N-acetyltransferase [Chloroflexota bacterium]